MNFLQVTGILMIISGLALSVAREMRVREERKPAPYAVVVTLDSKELAAILPGGSINVAVEGADGKPYRLDVRPLQAFP